MTQDELDRITGRILREFKENRVEIAVIRRSLGQLSEAMRRMAADIDKHVHSEDEQAPYDEFAADLEVLDTVSADIRKYISSLDKLEDRRDSLRKTIKEMGI